jgi:hypothetical protein
MLRIALSGGKIVANSQNVKRHRKPEMDREEAAPSMARLI